MSDAVEPSCVRRCLRAIGAAVAVPLRVADFVLGTSQSTENARTVGDVQHLAAMRDRGELTEDEYRQAKDKVLGGF